MRKMISNLGPPRSIHLEDEDPTKPVKWRSLRSRGAKLYAWATAARLSAEGRGAGVNLGFDPASPVQSMKKMEKRGLETCANVRSGDAQQRAARRRNGSERWPSKRRMLDYLAAGGGEAEWTQVIDRRFEEIGASDEVRRKTEGGRGITRGSSRVPPSATPTRSESRVEQLLRTPGAPALHAERRRRRAIGLPTMMGPAAPGVASGDVQVRQHWTRRAATGAAGPEDGAGKTARPDCRARRRGRGGRGSRRRPEGAQGAALEPFQELAPPAGIELWTRPEARPPAAVAGGASIGRRGAAEARRCGPGQAVLVTPRSPAAARAVRAAAVEGARGNPVGACARAGFACHDRGTGPSARSAGCRGARVSRSGRLRSGRHRGDAAPCRGGLQRRLGAGCCYAPHMRQRRWRRRGRADGSGAPCWINSLGSRRGAARARLFRVVVVSRGPLTSIFYGRPLGIKRLGQARSLDRHLLAGCSRPRRRPPDRRRRRRRRPSLRGRRRRRRRTKRPLVAMSQPPRRTVGRPPTAPRRGGTTLPAERPATRGGSARWRGARRPSRRPSPELRANPTARRPTTSAVPERSGPDVVGLLRVRLLASARPA